MARRQARNMSAPLAMLIESDALIIASKQIRAYTIGTNNSIGNAGANVIATIHVLILCGLLFADKKCCR